MTVKDSTYVSNNGGALEVSTDAARLLPGTTIPTALKGGGLEKDHFHVSTQSQPGPIIRSQATTITLYASRDLEPAGLIPGIHDLVVHAFGASHNTSGIFPDESRRLDSHHQLVQELSGPGTFTYVITYTGTKTVIGVASGKRYKDAVVSKPLSKEDPKSTFIRSGVYGPKSEGWELSLMAVDPSLQRQGLAGLLMNLVESEVKRRFVLGRAERGLPELGLIMLLTTVKEINWGFYVRRGYQLDYETVHEPGWLGSSTGFHVVHMSKQAEV